MRVIKKLVVIGTSAGIILDKIILDNLGIDRYCCRRMIISHVDLIVEAAPYE